MKLLQREDVRRKTVARISEMWPEVISELQFVSESANDAGRGLKKLKGGENAALLGAEMPSVRETH